MVKQFEVQMYVSHYGSRDLFVVADGKKMPLDDFIKAEMHSIPEIGFYGEWETRYYDPTHPEYQHNERRVPRPHIFLNKHYPERVKPNRAMPNGNTAEFAAHAKRYRIIIDEIEEPPQAP